LTDPVPRLIALGRDREAAELAVRETGGPRSGEEPMLGPLEQADEPAVDDEMLDDTTPPPAAGPESA
jgi:hypothetical protein